MKLTLNSFEPVRLRRRWFLQSGLLASGMSLIPRAWGKNGDDLSSAPQTRGAEAREQWLKWVERISEPVLVSLAEGSLRKSMPVEAAPGHTAERSTGTHLEAFGRLLAGLAPWLELEPTPGESERETSLRARYRKLAQAGLASAVDPDSPDYMRFGQSAQTLVDSSFLALGLLRAPTQLLRSMDATTKQRLVAALVSERVIQPPFSNWLLFAALNEVLLRALGSSWDRLRVDYALHELQAWYLGDGTYGDGPQFHADFYNSYVMHPYLLAIIDGVQDDAGWRSMAPTFLERSRRYAAIQERMISPQGEFPVLGRSITYRAGAFHLLADIARREMLPHPLVPPAVRGALTAVQRRTLEAPGTFTRDGWLQIGLCGHQPSLGESYISTGSLYLCSMAWLPLGLPPANAFWAAPAADWTQKAVWAGQDLQADHAMGLA